MIAEEAVVCIRPNGLDNFRRIGPVADHIAQADEQIGLHAADIEQDRLPGLEIRMDIGDYRYFHAGPFPMRAGRFPL